MACRCVDEDVDVLVDVQTHRNWITALNSIQVSYHKRTPIPPNFLFSFVGRACVASHLNTLHAVSDMWPYLPTDSTGGETGQFSSRRRRIVRLRVQHDGASRAAEGLHPETVIDHGLGFLSDAADTGDTGDTVTHVTVAERRVTVPGEAWESPAYPHSGSGQYIHIVSRCDMPLRALGME